MMKLNLRAGVLAAAIGAALATPALAQEPTAPPQMGDHGGGHFGLKGMRQAFARMSPEGRQTMMTALQALRNDNTRDDIRAARGRMLDLLSAEQLDVPALRRAMLEERSLSQAQRDRMQESMLAAFQRLSVADRRVVAETAREARSWIEQKRQQRRGNRAPQG